MYIKKLKIDAFGTLQNREIDLTEGLNIIEGANESGKSATAMFIKFMLYGLSGKSTGGELTERRRYVNWHTGTASGYMLLFVDGKEYRIERTLSVSLTDDGARSRETLRESVRIIDTATGAIVHKGEVPGEALFGVPENIFMNTVFIRQIDGTRINSAGILSAIENLLFTADETVGTKKALERLDDARRQILHKNGGGGLLGDLRLERSEAIAALREAETKTGSLIGSETDFEKAKKEYGLLKEKMHRQQLICRYGAVNLIKRNFDKAASLEKKVAEMRQQLAELTATGMDQSYLAKLDEAEKRIEDTSRKIKQLTAAKTEAGAQLKLASEKVCAIERETEEASTVASAIGMQMRSMTTAAICLFFLSVIAGVAAWFLYSFKVHLYTVPVVGAAILAALGVVCLTLRQKAKRKLSEHLAEWGALSAETIPAAILKKHGEVASPETLRAEKRQLEAALSEAITARREEAANGYKLASLADASVADRRQAEDEVDEDFITGALAAIVVAREIGLRLSEQTEELRRETDTYYGRLCFLREHLQKEDEAAIREAFNRNMNTVEGRIASGIDAPRLEAAKEELEKLKEAFLEAGDRMHRLETGIAAARAVTVSPAEIADKISALDTEIEELSKRHEAYCLAIDTLKAASDSMRASVLPKIVSEACASVNRIAGGTFEAIGVDETLSMSFTRGGQTREVEYLSEGTKDLSYISLRRALTGVLFGGTYPPLIYDESFSRLDEARLRRVLALLSAKDGASHQSILLTCHKIEAEIAAEAGGANLIRL
ncbi:MAG: AAA family ATPase [Clostridia bacterium]|nr:AAA family ATPase [Clostridia bacterium]